MTKVIFMTSGKIDYTFPNKTLYESIRLTASGKKFPKLADNGVAEVTKKAKELRNLRPSVIYSAPTAQCLDTARILSELLNIEVMADDNLSPLKFNLDSFLPEDEFDQLGEVKFDVLRKRYLESFFMNKLIDSNLEVKRKFETLKDDLIKRYNNKTVLVVSHAYIIKLFVIYNKIGEEMYQDKKTLTKLFRPELETMKRLETIRVIL